MRIGQETVTAKEMLESRDPEIRNLGKILLSDAYNLDYFNYPDPEDIESNRINPDTAIEATQLRANSKEPWRDFIK